MNKKIFTVIFGLLAINIFPQENNEENFFKRHFNSRVYLGYYSSYFDDNIQLLQGGYDAVLKLINITPEFNLMDVGTILDMNGLRMEE
jgi:hypothetical protein